jgi:protein disulfide-isomerase
MLASLFVALSATAQEQGIHWQQDIETAKAMAGESGRLVLVHVVADGCGPCQALEANVFAQPGVAGAIEQRFVAVKLNANEFPAIAQGFGITRVPTDVILTPDGQVLSKMISPATPAAYVADTISVATQYEGQSGRTYQLAAAAAPNPQVLNPAYANLAIGAPNMPAPAATTTATTTNVFAPPTTPLATPPAIVTNNYAQSGAPGFASPQQSVTPIPSNPAANPYAAYAPPTQPQPAAAPVSTPSPQVGYEPESVAAPQVYSIPSDASVPPANATSPVSEEAQRPTAAQLAYAVPDPGQLPAGAPPLGFDGYCPVSMRSAWKWVPGDPKYGAIHRGRTYWFASPLEQQEFLARPDYYGPALAGIDPVLAIDHQQSVPGVREHSLDYDGQFFLFSSEATLQQFTSSPERYASGVRQAMGLPPSQQTR